MNEILRNLTYQNFRNFYHSFDESKKSYWDEKNKKLLHSGEFGAHREQLVKKWLRVITPESFGIGSGFIVSPKGSISTQCDIIIYDKQHTPILENMDNQRFFPVETVCCIGEIKSTISSDRELNSHLEKLAKIKALRSEVSNPSCYRRKNLGDECHFDPDLFPFDNIFSFLICKNFKFKRNPNIQYSSSTPVKNYHNLILSLDDGISLYKQETSSSSIDFPHYGREETFPFFFFKAKPVDEDLPDHIIAFLSSLHRALFATSLLELDIVMYLTNNISKTTFSLKKNQL